MPLAKSREGAAHGLIRKPEYLLLKIVRLFPVDRETAAASHG